jgi:hypothetical protein
MRIREAVNLDDDESTPLVWPVRGAPQLAGYGAIFLGVIRIVESVNQVENALGEPRRHADLTFSVIVSEFHSTLSVAAGQAWGWVSGYE